MIISTWEKEKKEKLEKHGTYLGCHSLIAFGDKSLEEGGVMLQNKSVTTCTLLFRNLLY